MLPKGVLWLLLTTQAHPRLQNTTVDETTSSKAFENNLMKMIVFGDKLLFEKGCSQIPSNHDKPMKPTIFWTH